MEIKESTRTNENIQTVTENKNVIHTEEKVTIPTKKLKMKKKMKKQTYIVETTKETVNKTEESEYTEFQLELIQILEETDKSEKRTYKNVEIEDHEENISILEDILQGKENDQSDTVSRVIALKYLKKLTKFSKTEAQKHIQEVLLKTVYHICFLSIFSVLFVKSEATKIIGNHKELGELFSQAHRCGSHGHHASYVEIPAIPNCEWENSRDKVIDKLVVTPFFSGKFSKSY